MTSSCLISRWDPRSGSVARFWVGLGKTPVWLGSGDFLDLPRDLPWEFSKIVPFFPDGPIYAGKTNIFE